jgi:hypothetical protein
VGAEKLAAYGIVPWHLNFKREIDESASRQRWSSNSLRSDAMKELSRD